MRITAPDTSPAAVATQFAFGIPLRTIAHSRTDPMEKSAPPSRLKLRIHFVSASQDSVNVLPVGCPFAGCDCLQMGPAVNIQRDTEESVKQEHVGNVLFRHEPAERKG